MIAFSCGFGTAVTACSILGSPGPSAVSQSRLYESGHKTYDTFFETVHEVQMALGSVPSAEEKLRERLARKLDIEESAASPLIARALERFGQDLEANGTGLKLTVSGTDEQDPEEVDATIEHRGAEPDSRTVAILRAVERSAEEAGRLLVICRVARKRSEQLATAAPDLDAAIDDIFRREGIAKRAEVKKNMEDARKLIPLMLERASKYHRKSKKLLGRLQDALDTDHGQFDAPPPPPADETPANTRAAGTPGKGQPRVPREPSPAPPPDDSDFEP